MLGIVALCLSACAGPTPAPEAVDEDGDGYGVEEDCDDSDATVHPGAVELCDGQDQDCDEEIDERTGALWFVDADGDGFGDPWSTVAACESPSDLVAEAGDCDDADPEVNPSASDPCDGLDNDCDGELDEDAQALWYEDADGDGAGNPESTTEACTQPSGYVADDQDCDDTDAEVAPDAPELCNDRDDDCDDEVDEGAIDALTVYPDSDGDDFGSDSQTGKQSCEVLGGQSTDNSDCDDRDPNIHPLADERCNEVDDDCDGDIDEDPVDGIDVYPDVDGDGYGSDAFPPKQACEANPNQATVGGDCDDMDPGVYPTAEEQCGDGIDQDCSGADLPCG